MSIKDRQITVKLIKTIQEEQFEPFTIELQETLTIQDPYQNPKGKRKKIYKRLEKELDHLIDKRWQKVINEREDD